MYVRCFNKETDEQYLYNIFSNIFYSFLEKKKVSIIDKKVLKNIEIYLGYTFVVDNKVKEVFKNSNLYALLIDMPSKYINYTDSPLQVVSYVIKFGDSSYRTVSYDQFIENGLVDSIRFRLTSDDGRVDFSDKISNIIFKNLL